MWELMNVYTTKVVNLHLMFGEESKKMTPKHSNKFELHFVSCICFVFFVVICY